MKREEGPSEISQEAAEEDRRRDYIPRGEGNAAGWHRVGRYDGARRRALWVRFVDLDDMHLETTCEAIELCAGREGDDAYVRIDKNDPRFGELLDVFLRAADHIPSRYP